MSPTDGASIIVATNMLYALTENFSPKLSHWDPSWVSLGKARRETGQDEKRVRPEFMLSHPPPSLNFCHHYSAMTSGQG